MVELTQCPYCYGWAGSIGHLGILEYFRCQECGMTFAPDTVEEFS